MRSARGVAQWAPASSPKSWNRTPDRAAGRDGNAQECSSIGRAPVSKTGGWGFETLHSCQHRAGGAALTMARTPPLEFLRQARQEIAKVTWPTRKETTISTIMVIIMVIIMALFFFLVDQVLSIGVRAVLGLGG